MPDIKKTEKRWIENFKRSPLVDPFTGSGTTGVAAIELGRRYIGIEKSAEFAGWARKRLTVTKENPDAA